MNSVDIITLSGSSYYLADDLLSNIGSAFKGCRNGRMIINKKGIPKRHYTFAAKKNGVWTKTDGKSMRHDRVLITVRWFKKNVSVDDPIETAPDVIELSDDEKFRNSNGDIIEIEMRGERDVDKCYFSVKDIKNGFGIEHLGKTITGKKSGYINGQDYKRFYLQKKKNSAKSPDVLFLTYYGFLHLLYGCHRKTTKNFIIWATKTLFTAHLGTEEQKQNLAAGLLNVNAETIKAVFNKSTTDIPCVYLFDLGSVKDLRDSFDISSEYKNDGRVYKFGMTESIGRRNKQHRVAFSKIPSCDPILTLFSPVDPQYISAAETDVKNLFEGIGSKLTHPTHKELVIISSKQFKLVKDQYRLIGNSYRGHITDTMDKLKEAEHAKEKMSIACDLIVQKKDNEILQKDNEILQKDNEILRLRNEIAQIKRSSKPSSKR